MQPRDPAALEFLKRGRLDVRGRLVDASNATLFCSITAEGVDAECIYKPVAGERPLWDFPDGTLAGREVAAHLISEAGGFYLVPPTVLRTGPFGPGMVQLWVDTKQDDDLVDVISSDELTSDWRVVLHAHDRFGEPAVLAHADQPEIRLMAALDVVINNADRKGGHVLHATDGQIYGVDHGICLHTENKLRTVLWGFIGQQLPPDAVAALCRLRDALRGELPGQLAEHLTRAEVRAVTARTDVLLDTGVFPQPSSDWSAVPWPVF